MNVSYKSFTTKRHFGVEAEFSLIGIDQQEIAEVIRRHDYSNKVTVTGYGFSDGTDWQVKTDSTCGWEVASYKGSGVRDLANIAMCIEAIGVAGGRIDEDCGLHIHADVSDFTQEDIGKAVAYWLQIEPLLLNSVPTHRAKNKYCKSLRKCYPIRKFSRLSSAMSFYDAVKPLSFGNAQRRVTLNICNYVRSSMDYDYDRITLELRLPEATVDSYDVKNWVRLFLTFIENVKLLPMPDSCKVADIERSLCILGLNQKPGVLILSEALFVTKEWLLGRIVNYSRNQKLCRGAIDILNNMWFPLRKYHYDKTCEIF